MHMPSLIVMIVFGSIVFVLAMLLSIPFYALWSHHRRKMEEIRMRGQAQKDAETRAALEALRAELAALRDTTTQYDMSFDTALHRLESRIGHLERRVLTAGTEPAQVHLRQE